MSVILHEISSEPKDLTLQGVKGAVQKSFHQLNEGNLITNEKYKKTRPPRSWVVFLKEALLDVSRK
jgi:hypothetical protein